MKEAAEFADRYDVGYEGKIGSHWKWRFFTQATGRTGFRVEFGYRQVRLENLVRHSSID